MYGHLVVGYNDNTSQLNICGICGDGVEMSEGVYEMMNTSNADENILTVDFSFESSVKKAKAIEQIDKLVSLADNNNEIQFIDHQPTFFEVSRWTYEVNKEDE